MGMNPRKPPQRQAAMPAAHTYEATTRSIRIRVQPHYLADRSEPSEDRYFWAYTVEIANQGSAPVQLISREWQITDANGRTEEVRGPGVVGETPTIEPGESFTYTSGCPLTTPSGIMVGSYEMKPVRGARFDAAIPAFSLDSVHGKRALN